MGLNIGDSAVAGVKIGSANAERVYAGTEEIWSNAAPPGSVVFDAVGTHTFTVPHGYTEVSICMVGGGGSGSRATMVNGGGGWAGAVVDQIVSTAPEEEITVVVGGGGSPAPCSGLAACEGNPGASSSFKDITAAGGGGGIASGYNGSGGSRTTCGGTNYDGARNDGDNEPIVYGGQTSGFGKGGTAGGHNPYVWPEAGGVGSGGGANCNSDADGSGAGGRGEVRVSWGNAAFRSSEMQRLATDITYRKSRHVSTMPQKELDDLEITLGEIHAN